MQIWDISPPISTETPVFPGDTAYSQKWVSKLGPACPVNVSAITMSPHLGAHADAPLHYGGAAMGIGQVDLDPFLGPCRVIHAIGKGRSSHAPIWSTRPSICRCVCWSHVQEGANDSVQDSRLPLLKTITWLASLGVLLIGIDHSPSTPLTARPGQPSATPGPRHAGVETWCRSSR